MRKLLFLGFAHHALDDRLYYRQVCKLIDAYPELECIYAGTDSMGESIKSPTERYRILHLFKYKYSSRYMKWVAFLRACIKENPRWIQASDVREMIPALIIKLFTNSQLIYDSHEDYFNQAYEYSGKTIRGFIRGSVYRLIELAFVRFSDAVFCTDDYLYSFYKKSIFNARHVFLLRNFTNLSLVSKYAKPPISDGPFRLVYIGGVNQHRGVSECGEYVARYNNEYGKEILFFDVFGPKNSLIDKLEQEGKIRYCGSIPHCDIFRTLAGYHAGICLWQKIKKYERNLPIKNFEYMAVGLPVITSNFGNIGEYVRQVNCGLCTDPLNYYDFKEAINNLRNLKNWRMLSENGIRATKEMYNLSLEIEPYLSLFSIT